VEANAVDIRLTYEDYIPAEQPSKSDRRGDLKQRIRRVFSDQLRKRWRDSPKLAQWKSKGFVTASRDENRNVIPDNESAQQFPFFSVPTCGFSVVPLVTWHNKLGCDLDIVFTGEGRSAILPKGDLDNRLKTLFDALRMPLDDKEVPGHLWGKDNEELYCLLEDDSLIRKFCVLAVEFPGSPAKYDVRITARVALLDGYLPHPALEGF
jgi:hypothetical protein